LPVELAGRANLPPARPVQHPLMDADVPGRNGRIEEAAATALIDGLQQPVAHLFPERCIRHEPLERHLADPVANARSLSLSIVEVARQAAAVQLGELARVAPV